MLHYTTIYAIALYLRLFAYQAIDARTFTQDGHRLPSLPTKETTCSTNICHLAYMKYAILSFEEDASTD